MKNTHTSSISDVLDRIVKDRPGFVVPRTPEEVAAAKERLTQRNHTCQICHDAHFVHPVVEGKPDYTQYVTCQCIRKAYEQKKHDNLLKYCELPPKGRKMTFDNFKKSKATQEAFDACLSMAAGEFKETFLVLNGPSNHGKSHLTFAVCNYRLERGQLAKYTNVIGLLLELKEGFKPGADDSYMSRYNVFLTVPLLFLDDLGTENSTPWAQEQMNYLFEYRDQHELATLVTSNVPLGNIHFRIKSRLERSGKIITMTGPEFKR